MTKTAAKADTTARDHEVDGGRKPDDLLHATDQLGMGLTMMAIAGELKPDVPPAYDKSEE